MNRIPLFNVITCIASLIAGMLIGCGRGAATPSTNHYNQGVAKRAQGDLEGAIAEWTEAIQLQTNYAEAYFSLADAERTEGALSLQSHTFADDKQIERYLSHAVADYTKAIELKPQFAEAYIGRAATKRIEDNLVLDEQQLGQISLDVSEVNLDLDKAIADCNRALDLNPNLPDAYSNRGAVKALKHDIDGAIADCTKAINISPNFAEAYFDRASARITKSDLDGAIADCNKAIVLKPDFAGKGSVNGIGIF